MEKENEALSLFKALNKEKLRYAVVGGMAVVLYGVERATFDIDIALAPDAEDVQRLLRIFQSLGYLEVVDVESGKHIAKLSKIKAAEVIELNSVRVENGIPVDILIVPAETFDFLWKYRVEVPYKGAVIPIPSLPDLIHLKERSGRPIDLEDAKKLRYVLRTKRRK